MDNSDRPLSEVFDLTKHPYLRRRGVAIAFNVTSLLVLGLFIVERFWKPITGLVELVDKVQISLFGGYYLFFMSAVIATFLSIVPLLAMFKAYELLTDK